MTRTLSSGGWLNRRRVFVYGMILLALDVLIALYFALLSHGVLGPVPPNSTDFLSFYAAGHLVDLGQAGAVYHIDLHQAMQRHLFGEPSPAEMFYFFYPPVFLLLCAPLALLPYPAALAVWAAATLGAYVTVLGITLREGRLVLAFLSFPALFLSLGLGQNALLTASLLAGGLVMLERRPLLAGLLFGCLCYKPHFMLLVPLALLAGRHWRALGVTMLTAGLLAVATLLLFGTDTWRGFFGILGYADHYFSSGAVGYWSQVSIQAAARILGLSLGASRILQGAAILFAVGVTMVVWARPASLPVRAAVLASATLLSLPVGHAYDLTTGTVAIAWLVRRGCDTGFLRWERSVLMLLWPLPLFGIALLGVNVVARYGVPVLPLFALGLLALALRRFRYETKAAA